MVCPKCKTGHAHRSHRHGLVEHLASVVAYYPYRCRQCDHRFLYAKYATGESRSRKHGSPESAIARQRKRRDLIMYGMALSVFLVLLYFIVSGYFTPGPDPAR